jgi:hypothetical protein
LRYASSTSSTSSTIPTGTWRCMGYASAGSLAAGSYTLFLRIA